MQKLLHFLSYHNAMPVTLGIIFLGAGGAFAATNPEVVYSEQQTVLSVDNTYLVGKDLAAFTPRVLITGVTEDDEHYYVAFDFTTIDIIDYVWQDTVKKETLTVAKALLGQYGDLGLYATRQLSERIDGELKRLRETQEIEKTMVSQKAVATAYSGLVGKFLDDTMEVLPGYTPVVAPPIVFENAGQVAGAAQSTAGVAAPQSSGGGPQVQILGYDPSFVPLRASYADLGAMITSRADMNYGVHYYVDGAKVGAVEIDTSTTTTYTIRYEVERATTGEKGSATRRVIVYDPANPPAELSQPRTFNTPVVEIERVSPSVETVEEPTPPPSQEIPGEPPVVTPLEGEAQNPPPAEEEPQHAELAPPAQEAPREAATSTDLAPSVAETPNENPVQEAAAAAATTTAESTQ